jgi:hypothetical protein
MAGKDEGQGIMKQLILIITSIFLGLLFAVLALSVGFELQHYIKIHYGNHVVSSEVKARMRYHGISTAFVGWDGKTYFQRDIKNAVCKNHA